MSVNKAQCKNCGDIIESKYRHDWVACSCYTDEGNTTGIYIDGGLDYIRCGGNLSNYTRIVDAEE